MTSYVVEMQEDMAKSLTCTFLKQIKKNTADGGVMEACDIILTYLNQIKELPDFKKNRLILSWEEVQPGVYR